MAIVAELIDDVPGTGDQMAEEMCVTEGGKDVAALGNLRRCKRTVMKRRLALTSPPPLLGG